MADALDPNFVTPLVAYLVSEECELTHEIFDVGGGRYARIFVGHGAGLDRAEGQACPTRRGHPRPTSTMIREPRGLHRSPTSIADETKAIVEALKKRSSES